ncbi:MAG: AI-2E family transporter [Betaproteobacteria bacterium]|nr:AI-2E family transporter [Betaproteobacteria bacterium]
MDAKSPANRTLLALLLTSGGLYLLYLLAPILTPFLLAAALAYLCDPLVDRLEARKLPRALGTSLVLLGLVLGFVLLALVLAPLVQAEARLLMNRLPLALDWLQQTLLPWLERTTGVDIMQDHAQITDWLKAQLGQDGQLGAYLPRLREGGLAVLGFLANLVLVPVVTFYLLRDWDRTIAHLGGWVPAPLQAKTFEIAREVDAVLAEFVRGQIAVILVMVVYYSLGLWLVGLDYALAVGVVAGVLVFVPYLGVIVGLLLATLAGLGQHGELAALIPVWAVFGFGQLLEGMVITPRLVGERVGLHPVAVIFALMAFGQLFGFFGVLLAIPASAALLVGLRHLKRHLD